MRPILWYFIGRFLGERSAQQTAAQQQHHSHGSQQAQDLKDRQAALGQSIIERATEEGPHFELEPTQPNTFQWDMNESAGYQLTADVLDGPPVRITLEPIDGTDAYSFVTTEADPEQERKIHLSPGTTYQLSFESVPSHPTGDCSLLYYTDRILEP